MTVVRGKGKLVSKALKTWATCFLLMLMADEGLAHKVSSVSLISHLEVESGIYLLDAAMEVVPSDDDLLNEQIPPEEAARQFAEDFLVIMFDENEETPELEISIETASDENTPEELQRKQVLVKMTGTIASGSKEFLLYLEPTCPMAVVMVVIKDNKPSRRMQVILPGEFSRPVNIQPIMEGDPFVPAAEVDPAPDPVDAKEDETSDSAIGAGFLAFWKVSLLPLALTVSLFLLTSRKKPVFLQFAALMIGMSLALALAGWSLVSLKPWIVPATGLLLVILSGESLFRQEFHFGRCILALFGGFGIGLMLAGTTIFRLAIPPGGNVELASLIGFVFGAELALILSGLGAACFFLTMGRFDWYRKSVVTPVAVVLVAFGVYKAVESFL